MENNYFDKYLRDSLENLEPEFNSEHWDLFQSSLDKLPDPTGEGRSNFSFDEIARQKLSQLEADPMPGHWEMMEKMIDESEIPETADTSIDDLAYSHLAYLQPPYQPAHWKKMARKLNEEIFLRRIVYRYKLAEVALFLLILLTLFQFLPVHTPSADSNQAQAALVPSSANHAQKNHSSNATAAEQETSVDASTQVHTAKKSETVSADAGNVPPTKEPSSLQPSFQSPKQLITQSLQAASKVEKAQQEYLNGHPGLQSLDPLTNNSRGISVGLPASPLNMALLLPFQPINNIAVMAESGELVDLVECRSCKRVKQRGRLSIGMFGAADINYIMTPYNTKFRVPSYDQFFAGYGGGLSLTYQIKKWSVEIGGIYSSIFYQPDEWYLNVTGNLSNGFNVDQGFRRARLDVFKIPLNLRYRLTNSMSKWNIYALTGATMNTAVFKQYEIAKGPLSSSNDPQANPAPVRPGERNVDDPRLYKGFFENGRLKDNIYFTANLGFGVERYFNQRWSLFVQPVYQHQFLSNGDGFGPNRDRLNSFSTYIGIRRSLLK